MVKIYGDGLTFEQIRAYPALQGYTFNPSLARKLGVKDYMDFCQSAAWETEKPVSLEVISDDHNEMWEQAHKLKMLGENVYVKIPYMNSKGILSLKLIEQLSKEGVKVNVTACFTKSQTYKIRNLFSSTGIISIFAGRIADTGIDPVPICRTTKRCLPSFVEVLWASTREIYNVRQAEKGLCDIITLSPELLAKLPLFGKDLDEYSRETSQMFVDDAKAAGFTL